MNKPFYPNIREYVIKDKLGVGAYGTIFRVHKQGNTPFYILIFPYR